MKNWIGAIVCVSLGLIACSGDDSESGKSDTGCAGNPASCGPTETCWPNATGSRYECLPANASKVAGSACVITAGAADCAPGLFCFPLGVSPSAGVCSPFCVGGTCSDGALCRQAVLINVPGTLNLCQPSGTGGAGGTDGGTGGAGGTDAGTGASAGAGGISDAGAAD